MKHVLFGGQGKFKHAVLIKPIALRQKEIEGYYLKNMVIDPKDVIAFDLKFPENQSKNPSVKMAKEYLSSLLVGLRNLGVKNILVADSTYFKVLTKQQKVEPHYGYVLPSKFEGFEDDFNVVTCPNYNAIFHNPAMEKKIDLALKTFSDFINGEYQELHGNVIHSARYITDPDEAVSFIENELPLYPELGIDAETFSLKFYKAKIATLGFAWDTHNGAVISIDLTHSHEVAGRIKKALKQFFINYEGKSVYHNANYDIKVLCYELFMKDISDIEGMIQGITALTRNFDDTKLITYLALNNTSRV